MGKVSPGKGKNFSLEERMKGRLRRAALERYAVSAADHGAFTGLEAFPWHRVKYESYSWI